MISIFTKHYEVDDKAHRAGAVTPAERVNMWELVIIWASGEKEVVEYDSRQRATQGGRNYEMAFGTQVSWWCVREKR